MAKTRRVIGTVTVLLLATACQQGLVQGDDPPAEQHIGTWVDQQLVQNELMAQCMREFGGWGEEIIFANPEQVGIRIEIPGGMDDDATIAAIREATATCLDEFPPVPIEDFAITVAQAEAFYVALMAAGQCLRELGYPISEPPARQAIVEDALTLPIGIWDPWIEILEWQDPQHSFSIATAECPRPNIWDFTG